jgi:hypothetical protein
MTSISSLEFHQDAGKARKLAESEPVFITDRGEASHVLLSINEYNKLAGSTKTLFDNPSMANDMHFDPPRMSDGDSRSVEFD